jgi:hypothetical protein
VIEERFIAQKTRDGAEYLSSQAEEKASARSGWNDRAVTAALHGGMGGWNDRESGAERRTPNNWCEYG